MNTKVDNEVYVEIRYFEILQHIDYKVTIYCSSTATEIVVCSRTLT